MSPMLRILVVDDSAYNRRTISELLLSAPGIVVVGKASDGDEALRMAAELKPDLITLDLEMPRMDGFTFLRLLMARQPTPVIVVSGYSAKENVFRALELGALDFVAKPTRSVTADLSSIRDGLLEKVALVRHLSPTGLRHQAPIPLPPQEGSLKPQRTGRPSRIVLVGSSTGGPTALVELFRQLPSDTNASILVAQHMPPRFTRTFAERLDRLGGLRVQEASGVHALRPGTAWVCPGGKCMEIGADGQLTVVDGDPEDRYVPSVDRLFLSAARKLGDRAVAVVLTGMGDDGARGVQALGESGALIFAESAESAVIFGMPSAAIRTGHVAEVLPIKALGARLGKLISV